MRVSNIDTLSALLDRLICERIKHFFFVKEEDNARANHQLHVIEEIRRRIELLFEEAFLYTTYEYLGEKRTFSGNSIIEELDDLITNDINIGEADRARLEEALSDDPSIERLIVNEKRLRKANEGRARNKNKIDEELKKGIEG